MPNIEIRPASLADAEAIAFVHVTSWQETYSGLIPKHVLSSVSVSERATRWESILSGQSQSRSSEYVAEVDGEIVGFGSCGPQREADLGEQGFTGEIAAIYVLRRAQRIGLGTALMRTMVEHLRLDDHRGYSLWVLGQNLPARAFYETLGGMPVAERMDVRDYGSLAEVAYGWKLPVPS